MTEFDPQAPFRSGSGRDNGLSRRALTGKSFRRLHRDCYVSSERPLDLRTRVQAALEMVPGAYGLSHNSAVSWLGGVAPDTPDVHLAVPHGLRSELPGIRTHRYRKPPMMWIQRGVRCTAPHQTFVDLAPTTNLVELVVVGDSLVRRTSVTPAELVRFARESHANGVAVARRASAFVRSRVDSAQETRSRMLIVLAGLPEPTVDLRFYTDDGTLLRRIDMGYRDIKLAVEYDGRQHVERKAQWAGDIRRREYFDHLEWKFITLISPDIWTTPGQTVGRVRDGLAQRGVSVPVISDEWRLHFPERIRFETA
ncbi:hypothetical protein [Flexivirga oryzae]|uniref:DUF559 domain-containing protein n=1 Tax=Flexivirga oryzae TaxID=1794944 RepID=A0A839MYU8_9MICO|nr:hypothetical protein [Flexivirga oryzae]MBB2890588.1 hypothetical protein [Flexivirga oryzae]